MEIMTCAKYDIKKFLELTKWVDEAIQQPLPGKMNCIQYSVDKLGDKKMDAFIPVLEKEILRELANKTSQENVYELYERYDLNVLIKLIQKG